MLPSWRSQQRRRLLVIGVGASLVLAFVASAICAFGVSWAPLLWLPVCLVFLPTWTMLQIVSGR